MERDYSIHYHVWTQLDFLEFLLSLRDRLSYDIETTLRQADEFVIVFGRPGPVLDRPLNRGSVSILEFRWRPLLLV